MPCPGFNGRAAVPPVRPPCAAGPPLSVLARETRLALSLLNICPNCLSWAGRGVQGCRASAPMAEQLRRQCALLSQHLQNLCCIMQPAGSTKPQRRGLLEYLGVACPPHREP